ncbi:MAG: type II toxin-antitoxin system VapB family antitoxin [Deltaproteobacteria bacterium]|nr:type II toxin-antitoxin system VapB family antitoxin [Deltaproteobacteria bacterium]
MKRTNLMLNEDTLETATRLLGAKTYSEAVNTALEQAIQLHYMRGLADMSGRGVWEGELSEMRDDKSTKRKKRPAKKR